MGIRSKENGSITEAIRLAIKETGLPAYKIAEQAGVSSTTVSRFLRGERDMTLSVVDKLAPVLRLKVTWNPTKPAKGRQAGKGSRKKTAG